ncbi:MAG: isoprenylcysteine carboxylmethyltransferase family protein [Butyrivibrio sp.]|nr:isoprenylcysteine carboxylmethyltransferase family protein [Acetatifactor muris]MCM1558847.1 isoprenylcysteine carboxylmethyltransferase family protein [Butyrivibrio sp.]
MLLLNYREQISRFIPAYAVLLMIVFYGVYFIKLFHQRKQGIQTDLLGKGKTGFIKFIEITLKIVTYIVPAVEVISIFVNTHFDLTWLRITGAVLGGLGVGVFVISVITMRDSWRAGVPKDEKTELVTSGIYAYSRNPAFLGFDLIYIGELLMFFNWYLLVITSLAVIMLHLQIVNVEEDFLITAFGDEYLAYRKKVCRYIGRKS